MVTDREAPTPVGAVVRGLLASAVGTLAMDMALFASYRRDGGTSGFWKWESSRSVRHWDEAPAPAQVGKRLVEGLFQLELPDERARLVNNLTHWAYGLLAGAQYGLVVGSLPASRIWYGVPFGATVWSGGYVILPAAGLYRPIWEYDWRTLAKDLGAHLVYGVSTAAVFSRLARSSRPGSVAAREVKTSRRPGGPARGYEARPWLVPRRGRGSR